jgi:ParB family chromosome partitioning protein
MPKLSVQGAAGFNAGKAYYAKPVRVSDIVIDPEISKIFKVHDKILDEIRQKISESGYDKSQPVVIWKGKNILLDGHTRLAAAKQLGLEEIPAAEMEFAGRQEALLYTFERQAVRRNLTSAEILSAAQMIGNQRKPSDGKGRAAEQIAERIGVSPATIYMARRILAEAPKEELKAVRKGEKSIKAVYTGITKPRDAVFPVSDAPSLPGHLKFLHAAVILLTEAGENPAARLLVGHFLRKGEKHGFYELLPPGIRKGLEDEPQKQ